MHLQRQGVALSRPSLTQPSCDFRGTLTSVHPVSSLSCCSQEYASTPSFLPSGLRSVAKYTFCVSWAGTSACTDKDASLDWADGREPLLAVKGENHQEARLSLTRLISCQQVTSRLTLFCDMMSICRSGPLKVDLKGSSGVDERKCYSTSAVISNFELEWKVRVRLNDRSIPETFGNWTYLQVSTSPLLDRLQYLLWRFRQETIIVLFYEY